jgi:hypothetical protein
MDLKETVRESVDWIHLAQGGVKWQDLVRSRENGSIKYWEID